HPSRNDGRDGRALDRVRELASRWDKALPQQHHRNADGIVCTQCLAGLFDKDQKEQCFAAQALMNAIPVRIRHFLSDGLNLNEQARLA
ncbi:MAG: hypothetical protein IOC30_08320, partial [Burkholderia sp.]